MEVKNVNGKFYPHLSVRSLTARVTCKKKLLLNKRFSQIARSSRYIHNVNFNLVSIKIIQGRIIKQSHIGAANPIMKRASGDWWLWKLYNSSGKKKFCLCSSSTATCRFAIFKGNALSRHDLSRIQNLLCALSIASVLFCERMLDWPKFRFSFYHANRICKSFKQFIYFK